MLWTCEEFHRLGDLGIFEGRRPFLIDGVLYEEGPMNNPHAVAGTKSEDAIRELFGKGWHVRVQKPLVFGLSTDPEPDVAVIPGRPGDLTAHPSTADLILEVSDSTLRFDLTVKMSLYAAAGIADYWVLDLVNRKLLVHRSPRPDSEQPHGHAYADVKEFGPDESVSPLAAPNGVVRVSDLLP
jgi:Uma2 family endonuclease